MYSFTFLELPFCHDNLEDLFKLIKTGKFVLVYNFISMHRLKFPKKRSISKTY